MLGAGSFILESETAIALSLQLTTFGSIVKVRGPVRAVLAPQVTFFAEVAELVDALASGASGGNPVEVQVLSSVPSISFLLIETTSIKPAGLIPGESVPTPMIPIPFRSTAVARLGLRCERIPQNHRRVSIWPCRNNINRHLEQL